MQRLAAALVLAAIAAGDERRPLKRYTINLDLAPEERFVEVIKDHEDYAKAMVAILKGLFGGEQAQAFLEAAVLPEENRRELQGMADAIGMPYEDALLAHYFYELSGLPGVTETLPWDWQDVAQRSCTGVVAQDANGTILMGRNQDYPPPLSPLQFDGTFTRGGKVLYEATSFAGNIGVGGTCMVPGKFSAEINARDSSKPSAEEIIEAASNGKPCFPMLLRQGCEQGLSFEDAVKYYSDTDMILPGYVTIAGAAPGEGAVVTRNATAEGTDVLRLSDGYPADNPWFLIQTNYDHWTQTPVYDNRRAQGICRMQQLGQANVSLDTLWEVMSTGQKGKDGECKGIPGVYNIATIHTELVLPATGEYHTYLRHNIVADSVVV